MKMVYFVADLCVVSGTVLRINQAWLQTAVMAQAKTCPTHKRTRRKGQQRVRAKMGTSVQQKSNNTRLQIFEQKLTFDRAYSKEFLGVHNFKSSRMM